MAKKQVHKYVISKELGKGQFGIVYEAIHKETQKIVAIKIVSKQEFKKMAKVKELFNTEVSSLSKIKNKNVVGFVDFFEDKSNCYLVLEYCNGGDLEQYILSKKGKRLVEPEALEYFKQILQGLKGLHTHHIIHRDLKLANILLHDNEIKIADLGFAKQLTSEQATTKTILGTSLTMAPEVLEGRKYGLEADIYSVGVILYQMLYGKFPYIANTDQELVKKIIVRPLKFEEKIKVSQQTCNLLSKMIVYDRKKRINWPQIYKHPVICDEEKEKSQDHLTFFMLRKSRIDCVSNEEFYEHISKVDFNKKQEENVSQPQLQPIEIQDNEKELNDSEIKKIIEKRNQKKKQYEEIQACLLLYMHQRNCYNQLAKTVQSAHHLPATKVNTYIPMFLIVKKLLNENEKMLLAMEKEANLFNSPQFTQLLQNKEYKQIKTQVKQDYEMIYLYFFTLQQESMNIMNSTQKPNQEMLQEIEKQKEYTKNFNNLYKQTLTNYSVNLINEKTKYTDTIKKEEDKSNKKEEEKSNKKEEDKSNDVVSSANKLAYHIIQVIDCINYEKVLVNDKTFNFYDYDDNIKNLSNDEIQKYIENGITSIFK